MGEGFRVKKGKSIFVPTPQEEYYGELIADLRKEIGKQHKDLQNAQETIVSLCATIKTLKDGIETLNKLSKES